MQSWLAPVRRGLWGALALAAVALVARPARSDDPLPEQRAKARAVEARRIALIERLAPTVCAVFQKATVGQGGGSGVVIDSRGYVVTNFHVSNVEHDLLIGLNDGKLYKARLLGIDPGGDIALAKLEGKPSFAFAPMGVSDEVRPGDRVFAMGNPFLLAADYQPTITDGVVSGVHRFRDAAGGTELVYGDCIQIDASINPGNSGGPLFDEAGRWIGINGLGGFRPDRGRVNVGVGYAASVDQIKGFIEDLRSGQQCEHGTMDATVRDVPDDFDVSRTVVKIDQIVNESTAKNAGLSLGDILVEFDGVPVKTQNHFLTLISRLPAGRRVRVTFDRKREDADLSKKASENYVRRTVGFRLRGVPSGPDEGKWQPDEDLLASEKNVTLASARAGTLERMPVFTGYEIRGTRREAGSTFPFRYVQKGAKVRFELGAEGSATIIATDGSSAWRQLPDGKVEDLPRAEADAIEGTAVALDAALREGGEKDLNELRFTGGESLAGERTSRLETRDKSGRRRKLYFSAATGCFAGYAYPDTRPEAKGRWIEGHFVWRGDRLERIDWVDDATGDPIGTYDVASVIKLDPATADALFARPGGK